MSCQVSCDIVVTSAMERISTASVEENVMLRRLLSYYHVHMIPEGTLGRNFARFKYRRLKNVKNEEEKYRIKPRKKYAKQVWIRDGKAILVEPIEKRDEEE